MVELDKNKWLSSDTFEFKENEDKEMVCVKTEHGSLIKVIEKVLPDGSFTKFLRNRLKEAKVL